MPSSPESHTASPPVSERSRSLSWESVRFRWIISHWEFHALWILAITVYGLGDVLTTQAMLASGGVERNPAVAYLLQEAGVRGFVLAKAGIVSGMWWTSKMIPGPAKFGVPLGLLIVGSIAVVNNSTIVLT